MRKFTSVSLCIAALFFFSTLPARASTKQLEAYISKYRLVAQLESFRSGIPASIILAQGILESSFGTSDLANRSNNHFGIKWKGDPSVRYVYSFDDDYDKYGKHIPSKFIKYGTVEESYHHHTDFLLKRPNYRVLFKYKANDFVNWAWGLRDCGYSTDKDYAVQLIRLIRKYDLHEFDFMIKKALNSNALHETKTVVNLFNGKPIHRFSFIKLQIDALEEENPNIANVAKLNMETESVLKKPIRSNSKKGTMVNGKWAFIQFLNSTRFFEANRA
jgi:hypothetical protein